VLTLVAPGVGHVYARRPGRAITWLLLAVVVQTAWLLVLLKSSLAAALLVAVLALLLVLYLALATRDAVRCARFASPAAWPAWIVLLVVLATIGVVVVAQDVLVELIVANVAEAYRIPTVSMSPTLVPVDRVVLDKTAYWASDPARGDLVLYRIRQRGEWRDFVKRIVGLPGERVECRGGQVSVDGRTLVEPYLRAPSRDFESVSVAPRSYLVLGDDRLHSFDSSRPEHGLVPHESILGRVCLVAWSVDEDDHVAWDRVGLRPR
jgi:signal peptidase I